MSSAWNMQDGCQFTSDLDQHEAMNGRWDEREPGEDPNEEEDDDTE